MTMKIRLLFILIVFFYTITARTQNTDTAIAGIRADSLILVDGDEETIIAEATENYTYYPIDSNSRGELLYIGYANVYANSLTDALYIYDGDSQLITENFISLCPPYFEDDEHIIYLSSESISERETENGQPILNLPIIRYNVFTEDTESVNTMEYDNYGGGGGGSNYIMDSIVWSENLTLGISLAPQVFAVQDNYILTGQIRCHRGLQVIENDIITVLADRGVVTFSPDYTRVAVMEQDDTDVFIRVYQPDSTSRLSINITDFARFPEFRTIHWADNGMIYFSATTEKPMSYDLEDERLIDFLDGHRGTAWDQSRDSWIYQVNPDSGQINEFHFASNTWAIMRIDSDGNIIYWSEIPDGTTVINAVLSGEIDTSYSGDIADDYLMPDVYRMSLAGGEPELITENLQRFITVSPSQ